MQHNFTTAIQRGMAWLDEEHPGWERDIDLEKLDMGDSCLCVLGQLEGEYTNAMRRLFGSFAKRNWEEQGKFEEGYAFEFSKFATYRQLTAAWKTAITHRLATKEHRE